MMAIRINVILIAIILPSYHIIIEFICNICFISYINAIIFKIKYFSCFISRKNFIYDFPSIFNVIFGTVKNNVFGCTLILS